MSDHVRLTNAGWSYRTNENRGWVVYRDPLTGLWHERGDAVGILDSPAAASKV